MQSAPQQRPRLGISSCLLGERVRYDGAHKRDPFLVETFGEFVEWVPVCPEVECGLPVPREAMRLVGQADSPRLVTVRTGVDLTEKMRAWAAKRVRELEKENLVGCVFKSGSPSSGMMRVKVYDANGVPRQVGVGIFARAFMEHFPLVPVEEEGGLHDPGLRENFIERIFALDRWRRFRRTGGGRGGLVDFHARHKLLLMSHSPALLRQMGVLVAHADRRRQDELLETYERLMMKALSLPATRPKHVNVIQHMMGYVKKTLSADEKREMLDVIDRYRKGLVPLIVPVTLIRHYVRKYDVAYLREQCYLDPHPMELRLRNHA